MSVGHVIRAISASGDKKSGLFIVLGTVRYAKLDTCQSLIIILVNNSAVINHSASAADFVCAKT